MTCKDLILSTLVDKLEAQTEDLLLEPYGYKQTIFRHLRHSVSTLDVEGIVQRGLVLSGWTCCVEVSDTVRFINARARFLRDNAIRTKWESEKLGRAMMAHPVNLPYMG